ncbi:NAD-dependent dehydratase [Candidatus Gottesmanbacteria bacterium RIFCSPHIGHO2_02_FULL_39_11]|uniref:NAD-dependent dehydratase n=1 Tax=Candidatus Gottesmanbacteria bacterium RIFCSPHIGHO2_02_FULL_39_11 TaxID=1798382 RepID=A0A1F5ZJC0_9BACT|nr:MAG: NAD-dependent dehydratase [Candidatus Gottesmanbacteria bacterium RIFCSPHIGHO2_02_FULL_39_11]
MKILLTGNEGYIGAILSDALLNEGFDAVGYDTGFYNRGSLYTGPKKLKRTIRKDIRDIEEKDMEGIDTVIHLAELSNDPLGQNNPELTYLINHEGTKKLIDVCKKSGVSRFIYFSSCSVYGANDEYVDEDSETHPLTMYAKCKVLNENYLLKNSDSHFSPIIFRNATVYGASPRMRFDLAVNNLAGVAFTTHEIKMESDGTAWRPFVHIQDVSRAVIAALKTPSEITHNQIINIGSKKGNYQIKSIAEIISEVFPKCRITKNLAQVDKRNYKVHFEKAEKLLTRFSCSWTLEKGIIELFDRFNTIHLTKTDFYSSSYTRLAEISHLKKEGKLDNTLFWRN